MAQKVSAIRGRIGDACSFKAATDNARDDGRCAEWAVWRHGSQKNFGLVDTWAHLLDIDEKRVVNLLRQRKTDLAPALALHAQHALSPGDVAKFHRHHVMCAKTEAGEEKENRPVPDLARGGTVGGVDQAFDIGCR